MNEALERRVDHLEEIHTKGGACDEQNCSIWKAITALDRRVTALEIKLLIGGSVIGVAGPLLAQWIFKRIGG